MTQRKHAIILAGGLSSRMTTSKQLLQIKGVYMLERVIKQALSHPFDKVTAVIGHDADKIMEKIIVQDERFEWSVNDAYRKGQSNSLKNGLNITLPSTRNAFIFLGDLPFIQPQTISRIIQESESAKENQQTTFIIRPIYQDKIGHPVFIGNLTKDLISQISGDSGLRSIRNKIPIKIKIPVDDPGILQDIDTIEDYQKYTSKIT